ncbi:hypothetical protein STRAU_5853 [Streptomyces aurantiacus JA 4570]|uniref:VOC domain-containing protein n=1 Tax=Streptomyces aurantiacus JA 4570 TaxID=1286094 RepID=S3ZBM9_9ACTN|nr:hypothetical protein STRAU_5853 [Streptomyces aurantiacus JA 4570]
MPTPMSTPMPAPAPAPGRRAPREIRTLADKLLEVHDWLRGELVHLRAEAAAHLAERAAHQGPGEPPAPGLGLQIRQRCLEFCDALTFHHTGEDDHVFPGVAAHHPHLRPTLERLGAEHLAIARIKESLVALLADLAAADPAVFLAEFDRMAAELTAHLEFEETWLVPVLAEVPFPPVAPAPEEGTPVTTDRRSPVRVKDFDHLVLNVQDVERALDFYCGTLGLEPVRVEEWRAGKVPFPSARVSPVTIIDLVAGERGESGESNVDHICLVVEPLDWQEVVDSGPFTVLEGPVGRFGARGDAQSIYVRDPDGNSVELRWYPEDQ